ncbi:MAG TPA: hypothetical protein DEB39_05565 [Planctomycetaceae bacterium]|nr:hypothetical protein [Planctomycetaceae bacterium]
MYDFLLDYGPVGMLLLLTGGFVFLIAGGISLVRNVSRCGSLAGLSPLFVALTLAACCACAPEAAIAVIAARHENSDFAVGTIIGGCTLNICLILGLASLCSPIRLSGSLVWFAIPLTPICALFLLLLTFGGGVGTLDDLVAGKLEGLLTRPIGFFLCLVYVTMTMWAIFFLRRNEVQETLTVQITQSIREQVEKHPYGGTTGLFIAGVCGTIIGVGLLVLGSDMLIKGASMTVKILDVSELLVGLTLLAIGTSLPELLTMLVAVKNNRSELAVATVIGSNIVNLLGVFGVTALLTPGGLPIPAQAMQCDIPILIIGSILCTIFCYTDRRLTRPEGLFLLLFYAFYMFLLLISALSGW